MYINQSYFINENQSMAVYFDPDHPNGNRIRVNVHEVNSNFPEFTISMTPNEAKDLWQTKLYIALRAYEDETQQEENDEFQQHLEEGRFNSEETQELIDADNRDRAADMRNY